ncbi:MAG: pseudouridine synthase [Rikenellaceae bacterium]
MKKEFTSEKGRTFRRDDARPSNFDKDRRNSEPRKKSFNPNFDDNNRFIGGGRSERPSREGGFNREGGFGREGRVNREGGFNRDSRPNREGGFSRERKFERTERPSFSRDNREDRPSREGSFNRDGGFSREGRVNREGGFNRDSRPNREGGFNRERKFERTERPAFGRNSKPNRNKDNYPRFDAKVSGEMRLNRYVANSGVCSRREADDLITAGLVSVNGTIVTELGTKVSPSDTVRFNDEVIKGEKNVYILMNKPKGFVTTIEDPHAERTVMDLLRDACTERIYPVGRLDKNTMGVLLFTNDGDLTKKLTHPSYNKAKIYQVSLDRAITQADMLKLESGVVLEDGEIAADEVNFVGETRKEVGIEIHSGRNRIVRRMFDSVGYNVEKLDRVYFAGLTKKNLKRGDWRFLTPQEVILLKNGQYR